MSDNPIVGIKEQQKRRKRINRIKMTLLWVIIGWILISMITCIFLGIKIFSLNKKINKIYDYLTSASGNAVMSYVDQNAFEEEDMETEVPLVYSVDKEELIDEEQAQKVYLTFDDGPSKNTEKILDILKQYDVKATFFVVGRTDEHSKEMYKRIVEEGHTIANHTYSHKYSKIYDSVDVFEKEIDKLNDLVYEVTGVRTKYLRFPGGSSNQVNSHGMEEFIELVEEKGYIYFDWNVVNGDATSTTYTPRELRSNVLKGVKKHQNSVVLMHDAPNKTSTVEALPKLIEELQKKGYKLLPIDENTKVIQHVAVESVVNE